MRIDRLSHPINGSLASFILKKVETEDYNPDDADSWDTRRFFNDWVGSQFLSTIPSNFQHSPHFYGGDRQLGFIMLEDVQHDNSLVEPLLGDDRAQAEWTLLEYATCLGQLHTETIGKAAEFEELFKSIAPNVNLTRTTMNIFNHQLLLENLGIYPDSNLLHDLESIDATVSHPGEFLAYIHAEIV